MIIHECEQNSPEWYAARLGLPTASMFATIMAKGKDGGASVTRRKYLLELAGEKITGEVAESYTNANMERGKIMEKAAREMYAFKTDTEPRLVGFITNGDMGCSPDSLINEDGGLEIKTALPHIQIERIFRNDLPPEHKAQVQGTLMVTERPWWDFMSYWPKCPPLIVKVRRDEPYISNLRGEIDRFNDELAATVERIRAYDPSSLRSNAA